MSYDAPPLEQTTAQPKTAQVAGAGKLELPADLRRRLNATLPDGYVYAVNYPPGGQRAHLAVVRLPRSNSGWPSRRPVQIPLDSFKAVQSQRPRRITRRQLARAQAGKSVVATMAEAVQAVGSKVAGFASKTKTSLRQTIMARARALASFFGMTDVPVSNVEVCPS